MNDPITSPIKAIRAKCLDCSNGSHAEVDRCPVKGCPLFPFRFGKNPFRATRELTEEHKAALRAGREKALLEAEKAESR